jgi:hypothetical protein
MMKIVTKNVSQAPVAHTCNPSYSGSRDQKDCSSKPAQANRPYLKNPVTKNWAGGVDQGETPEFKPQYCRKKKKKQSFKSLIIILVEKYSWETIY